MNIEMNEWQKIALEVIGIVDYDIEKETRNWFEEEGEHQMLDEVAGYLRRKFGAQK